METGANPVGEVSKEGREVEGKIRRGVGNGGYGRWPRGRHR